MASQGHTKQTLGPSLQGMAHAAPARSAWARRPCPTPETFSVQMWTLQDKGHILPVADLSEWQGIGKDALSPPGENFLSCFPSHWVRKEPIRAWLWTLKRNHSLSECLSPPRRACSPHPVPSSITSSYWQCSTHAGHEHWPLSEQPSENWTKMGNTILKHRERGLHQNTEWTLVCRGPGLLGWPSFRQLPSAERIRRWAQSPGPSPKSPPPSSPGPWEAWMQTG